MTGLVSIEKINYEVILCLRIFDVVLTLLYTAGTIYILTYVHYITKYGAIFLLG